MPWRLRCPKCGYASREESYVHKCPQCGSPMDLEGELPSPGSPLLGEGNTPLVEEEYRGSRVFLKLEYLNPTGSFKDRGSSLSVYLARMLGYRCVVEDSSGNTGISVAAYSSHMGLNPVIVVPRHGSPSKKSLIRLLGAEVVEAGDRAEAAVTAEGRASECFYVSHATSPVFIEGVSSLALEIPEHLRKLPIIVPVSSGTLLLGLARGLERLGEKPNLIAVQSSEAASLEGRVPVLGRIGGPSSRLADALVYKDPPRIEEMGGVASGLVIVGDKAIIEALRDLLGRGYIVEPSSAAAWAAYKHLKERGVVGDAIVLLTGSGLKYVGELGTIVGGQA